ncbi:MAG TPA: hypothetical protein VMC44_03885 [Geobacteraceae bacterium]|nr:hypothetical protein [Geobacteraceae bacterium]
MAGKIKEMIDALVSQRAQGNSVLEGVVKIKLILKGIDPKNYSPDSPDDPAIIAKLEELMREFK